jgi:hypothetical protein
VLTHRHDEVLLHLGRGEAEPTGTSRGFLLALLLQKKFIKLHNTLPIHNVRQDGVESNVPKAHNFNASLSPVPDPVLLHIKLNFYTNKSYTSFLGYFFF